MTQPDWYDAAREAAHVSEEQRAALRAAAQAWVDLGDRADEDV